MYENIYNKSTLILYGNSEFVKWKLCEKCGKMSIKITRNWRYLQYQNTGSKNDLSIIKMILKKAS